jgi:hypothetical protein
LPTVSASAASTSASTSAVSTAAHSPSLEAELTRTLQRFLEVIPIVPGTHSVSLGYTSFVRYSYYIPHQY